MQETLKLHIDWATHEAAVYACTHWHYSRSIPSGKLVKVGVWENGIFKGVVIFGRGANNNTANSFGVDIDEYCELVRVALTSHKTEVTRIIRLSLLFLKKISPGLKVIASYADPRQSHHGGIYQGGNWIYLGKSVAQRELLVNGCHLHKRSATSRWGTAKPESIEQITGFHVIYGPKEWKHVYVMPLCKSLKKKFVEKSKPYPKRLKQAMAGTTGTAAA